MQRYKEQDPVPQGSVIPESTKAGWAIPEHPGNVFLKEGVHKDRLAPYQEKWKTLECFRWTNPGSKDGLVDLMVLETEWVEKQKKAKGNTLKGSARKGGNKPAKQKVVVTPVFKKLPLKVEVPPVMVVEEKVPEKTPPPVVLLELHPNPDSDRSIFPDEIIIKGEVIVKDLNSVGFSVNAIAKEGRYAARKTMISSIYHYVIDTDSRASIYGSSVAQWKQREKWVDSPTFQVTLIV